MKQKIYNSLVNIRMIPYNLSNFVYAFSQKLYLKRKKVSFKGRAFFCGNTHWSIGQSTVTIGDNFKICSGEFYSIDNQLKSKVIVGDNAVLTIGNNVGMTNISLNCHESIMIGDNTLFGAGCLLMDSDFHSVHSEERKIDTGAKNARRSPIVIGSDCFIGARTIICKGVSIGDKSIVAAGSVVTRNIPSCEVWGGNPVCFIKKAD